MFKSRYISLATGLSSSAFMLSTVTGFPSTAYAQTSSAQSDAPHAIISYNKSNPSSILRDTQYRHLLNPNLLLATKVGSRKKRSDAEVMLVPQIPSIMRKFGEKVNNPQWENAAKMQDIWLGFPKHVATPIAPERFDYSVVARPTQTGVTIDWILRNDVDTDGRAKTAFGILQALLVSDTDGQVKSKIQDQVNKLFASTSANTVSLGSVSWSPTVDIKAFHAQRVQASAVTTDPLTTPIDPLLGALGSFNFYAIPVGQAQKRTDGTVQVDISDFVLYALDSFDFVGPQLLGYFEAPDTISKNPFDGGVLMTNGGYRDYRDSITANPNVKGGDFLAVTDTRTAHLPKSFTFTPEATINGTWTSTDTKHRFKLSINGNTVAWMETGVETNIVYTKTLNITPQGDTWRIERSNNDLAVLKMLGFQDQTLQQAILDHNPHPSLLVLKFQASQLVAKWSGIRVKKTPQGAFQSLVQPEDASNPASDYAFTRTD